MEPQTLINGLFGLLGVVGGWMLNRIWTAVDSLQTQDQKLAEKVQAIEILVAGTYVKRDELEKGLEHLAHNIFLRLDRIERKLDEKADK